MSAAPAWCPALLRRRRDLAAVRHDFPLLLLPREHPAAPLCPLATAIDAAAGDAAEGDGLAVEAALRRLTAAGAAPLTDVVRCAAPRLTATPTDEDRIRRRRLLLERLATDCAGALLVGCDADAPARVVAHLYRAHVEARGAAIGGELAALAQALARVLDADTAAAPAAWGADGLRAAIGPAHAADFDFVALATLLAPSRPARTLPPARRARIADVLSALRRQRVFGDGAADAAAPVAHRVGDALAAWRDRLPAAAALLDAVRVARRELCGADHGGADDASPIVEPTRAELALFPVPLLVLDAETLSRDDALLLLDALAAGTPLKAVVRTATALPAAHAALGAAVADSWRAQLGAMAAGLGTAYVVQGTAAQLARLVDPIAAALAYDGPALAFVYAADAGSAAALPPYLLAAAAAESRTFLPFVHDPETGAAILPPGAVSDPEADWPGGVLDYEDDRLQAISEALRFTTADFLAAEPRLAAHFRAVPRAGWSADMLPVDAWLGLDRAARRGRRPYVVVVDGEDRLQRLVPDDAILEATRGAVARWRRLRRQSPAAPAAAVAGAPASPVVAEPRPAAAPATGAAWVETGRCSSCHECLDVSSRLFAYDENGQAYLRDAEAGTYRELVEAAERCKLGLIHPGEPRQPEEPGVDELRRRAEPFR